MPLERIRDHLDLVCQFLGSGNGAVDVTSLCVLSGAAPWLAYYFEAARRAYLDLRDHLAELHRQRVEHQALLDDIRGFTESDDDSSS